MCGNGLFFSGCGCREFVGNEEEQKEKNGGRVGVLMNGSARAKKMEEKGKKMKRDKREKREDGGRREGRVLPLTWDVWVEEREWVKWLGKKNEGKMGREKNRKKENERKKM